MEQTDWQGIVSGPFRDCYIALYACPVGELGQEYVGYYRICTDKPHDYFQAKSLDAGCAPSVSPSARAAVRAAEAAALLRIGEIFPSGANEQFLFVVYLGSFARPFRTEHVPSLASKVIERNRVYGITSVLLHDSGNFIHYLEGPPVVVEAAFNRVAAEGQYGQLLELLHGHIAKREFPNWPFKFFCRTPHKRTGAEYKDEASSDRKLLFADTPSPGRWLLVDFARRAHINV